MNIFLGKPTKMVKKLVKLGGIRGGLYILYLDIETS